MDIVFVILVFAATGVLLWIGTVIFRKIERNIVKDAKRHGVDLDDPRRHDALLERVFGDIAEELQHKANVRKARRDAELRDAKRGKSDGKPRF